MTALAASPPRTAITASVRQQLLVSLIADLSDVTVEGLNAAEMRELLRPLGSPFVSRRLAVDLPFLPEEALRVRLQQVRRACQCHFEGLR